MASFLYQVCFIVFFLYTCLAVPIFPNAGTTIDSDLDPEFEGASVAKAHIQRLGFIPDPADLPAVVAIPGIGGNQLQAEINFTEHWYCDKTKGKEFPLWLQLTALIPGPEFECFLNVFPLQYNATSNRFSNASGTEVFVTAPGTTLGFEYLDNSNAITRRLTTYFAKIVSAMLAVGYTRDINVFGAPYDWRSAPSYQPGYLLDLENLIYKAYAYNQKPVVVICHSMGNMMFMTFLKDKTQEWKDKYIADYIAVAPPMIGALKPAIALTSGYNFGIPYFPPANARNVERGMSSNYFILPTKGYYPPNTTIITTPSRTYTADDMADLVNDIDVPGASDIYNDAFNNYDPSKFPGINVHCLYGTNVSTTVQATYPTDSFDSKPTYADGDGDGTVDIDSLRYCEKWAGNTGNKTFQSKAYPGAAHVAILSKKDLVDDILSVLTQSSRAAL